LSSSSQIDNACGLADDADRIERLLEVCVLDILVADPNLLEDRLIDEPSLLRTSPQIEVVDVSAEKRQDERKRTLKLVVPKAEPTDDGGRVDAFPLDARTMFSSERAARRCQSADSTPSQRSPSKILESLTCGRVEGADGASDQSAEANTAPIAFGQLFCLKEPIRDRHYPQHFQLPRGIGFTCGPHA
jgi:hypothetical protein